MTALGQAWRAARAHPVRTILLFLVFLLIGSAVQIGFLSISISQQVFATVEREFPSRLTVMVTDTALADTDIAALCADARVAGAFGHSDLDGVLPNGTACVFETDYNCAMTDLLLREQAQIIAGATPGNGVHGVVIEESFARAAGLSVGDTLTAAVSGAALSLPVTGIYALRYPLQYVPADAARDAVGLPVAENDPRPHFLADRATLSAAGVSLAPISVLWLYVPERAALPALAESFSASFPQYAFFSSGDIVEQQLFRTLEASNLLFVRFMALLLAISLLVLFFTLLYDFREYAWEDGILRAIGYTRAQRIRRFLWRILLPGLPAAVLTGGAASLLCHRLTQLWITLLFQQDTDGLFTVDLSTILGIARAEVFPPAPAVQMLLAAMLLALIGLTCALLARCAQRGRR